MRISAAILTLRKAAVIAPVILVLGAPAKVAACSCGRSGSVSEAFERASAVFVGRLVSVAPVEPQWRHRARWWAIETLSSVGLRLDSVRGWISEDFKRLEREGKYGLMAEFEVSRGWKGVIARRIAVRTGYRGGDCGYEFEVGRATGHGRPLAAPCPQGVRLARPPSGGRSNGGNR